jgi:ornithine cyclodeaminase/alanine dehydrogenase-like protein (mu-crystallin family)
MALPPLRYLSSADVEAAMPGIEDRLRLAERSMVALDGGGELPPKIGVHPAATESFAHAMPAVRHALADRGQVEAPGEEELLGLKWVAGFPSNLVAGLPAIHATTILSDARTGQPRAFLDAGVLTAVRTAAVSGLAIRRWGPQPRHGLRVALIGAGVQARSHLPVIGHLLPEAELVVCDRDAARAEAIALEVASSLPDRPHGGTVRVAEQPAEAVAGADLVLTLISFGPHRQAVPGEAFAPEATIVAVDYDMCVPASVAVGASLFLVDHREQYLANQTSTTFAGYPREALTIGEAIRRGTERPAGRVLVTHLGVGLADVVFADAVLRTAESLGIGTILPR